MIEEKLLLVFRQDCRKFINRINDGLIAVESGLTDEDTINELFRSVHSIKSEAAYLQFDEISALAHEMETVIDAFRNESAGGKPDAETMENLYTKIDLIEDNLLKQEDAESPDEPEFYSNFELQLISEALSRGEKLYRIDIRVSEDETMKYPRLYLAMSRLEMKNTVIKTIPEMKALKDGGDSLSLIVSSAEGEKRIAEAVRIDQIEDVRVQLLDAGVQLRNGSGCGGEVSAVAEDEPVLMHDAAVISVEASELDVINTYVAEIKKRIARLSQQVEPGADPDGMALDLKGLENVSSGIEKVMNSLKTVDSDTYFAGYRRIVRDLAVKLGKKADLEFVGGGKLLRDFADFIAEPMLQLLRNSVVHGIETPDRRIAAGKAEAGRISVEIETAGAGISLSVSDDGQGIADAAAGRADALLDTIAEPGYTTAGDASEFAGRGVGLDIVRSRIAGRGGRLVLHNEPGSGCRFTMSFPAQDAENRYLIVRSGDSTCAVKIASAVEVFTLRPSALEGDAELPLYAGLPVYGLQGRLTQPLTKDTAAVMISYLGNGGCFIFDEALFETRMEADEITEGGDVGGVCRQLLRGGRRAEYDLLSPERLFG